tara:strand:- start:180 stop:605 length:426 start_codon:yes stop_codon:yes gene_type:complete
MIGVVQIPKENIEQVWSLVDDSITKALQYSGNHFNTLDVYEACLNGDNQLWLVWDEESKEKLKGVMVSRIIVRPNTKVANIFICTGKQRKLWQDRLHEVEKWAKSNKCTHFETYARPGWSKLLKQQGFKTTHYLLEKKLEK